MKLLSLSPHFTAWHFPLGTFDNFQLNYKDHLGNNRLSYTLDPETHQIKILEENPYYPFGLKHGNYNAIRKDVKYKEQAASKKEVKQVVPEAVKFKYYYQEQERQDELGLNWDAFKYRNYDYAIGRFLSVDPLAEKYAYNSTYAFQENKMGLGRELEGLEMTSERSKDGKTVTITYRIRAVNNTGGLLTHKQFRQLVEARKTYEAKFVSGKASNGVTLKFKVVEDKNATIVWNYNASLDVSDIKGQIAGNGHVKKIGDTQNNSNQIPVVGPFQQDENGNIIYTQKGVDDMAQTGGHEDMHVGGLRHPGEIKDREYRYEVSSDANNMMHRQYGGNHLIPKQRTQLINNVESQQPNNTQTTGSSGNSNSNSDTNENQE